MPKASAIIIGNEILNGKVQDTNSVVLARTLFECGVALKKIETIPDHTDTIIETLREHARDFDLVFTSGGIGPTHDDITYDAAAKAFNQSLKLHPETVERYTQFYGRKPDAARQKMALLPEKAEIVWTPNLWVPTVFIDPVYVLPGIPEMFSQILQTLKHRFTYKSFERALVYTKRPEGDIAFELEKVQQKFPDLDIGSYPQMTDNGYRTMLSIEGQEASQVKQAAILIEAFA